MNVPILQPDELYKGAWAASDQQELVAGGVYFDIDGQKTLSSGQRFLTIHLA